MQNLAYFLAVIVLFVVGWIGFKRANNSHKVDERELFIAPKWLSILLGSKRPDNRLVYRYFVLIIEYYLIIILAVLHAFGVVGEEAGLYMLIIMFISFFLIQTFLNDQNKK